MRTNVKRSLLYTSVIGIILSLVLVLSSCVDKPETLEALIDGNSDIQEDVQAAADAAGMTVTISGNDITYAFDLATVDGVTEENLKDDVMIESLQSALDSQKSTFSEMCRNIEEESGIGGIKAIVNYTYGDEVLATQSFTSSD